MKIDSYNINDNQEVGLSTSVSFEEGKTYKVTYTIKANKFSLVDILPAVVGDVDIDNIVVKENDED